VLHGATGAGARAALERGARAHEASAQSLRDAIEAMGGAPAADSGARGTLAQLYGRGALALGGRTGVAALARSEDRAAREYRDNVGRLDARGRSLVEHVLLPARERTKRAIHDLSWSLS
jgi:hypothetical protein